MKCETYDESGSPSIVIDDVTWTCEPNANLLSQGTGALNDDSCGSYHLAYTNILTATYIHYTYSADATESYITGWVKVSDAATALADNLDAANIIYIDDGSNYSSGLRLRNDSGTINWYCYYEDNYSNVYSSTYYAYSSGASLYFKIHIKNGTPDQMYCAIGVNPETLTVLVDSSALSHHRNPRRIILGILSNTGMAGGSMDIAYDSIAIDSAAYERVEYKE